MFIIFLCKLNDFDIICDEDTMHFIKDDYQISSAGKQRFKGYNQEKNIYKINL